MTVISETGDIKITNKHNHEISLISLFSGEAIDLDSFCGNIISECEKTEEMLMNSWFKEVSAIFVHSKMTATTETAGGSLIKLKDHKLLRYSKNEDKGILVLPNLGPTNIRNVPRSSYNLGWFLILDV